MALFAVQTSVAPTCAGLQQAWDLPEQLAPSLHGAADLQQHPGAREDASQAMVAGMQDQMLMGAQVQVCGRRCVKQEQRVSHREQGSRTGAGMWQQQGQRRGERAAKQGRLSFWGRPCTFCQQVRVLRSVEHRFAATGHNKGGMSHNCGLHDSFQCS